MLQIELGGFLGPRRRVRSVAVDYGRARLETGEGVNMRPTCYFGFWL